jgi:hypothetical protein
MNFVEKPHELKEIGDQWCTPDNIFWGINAMFGPLVLICSRMARIQNALISIQQKTMR